MRHHTADGLRDLFLGGRLGAEVFINFLGEFLRPRGIEAPRHYRTT
jgi:hypothetical protein